MKQLASKTPKIAISPTTGHDGDSAFPRCINPLSRAAKHARLGSKYRRPPKITVTFADSSTPAKNRKPDCRLYLSFGPVLDDSVISFLARRGVVCQMAVLVSLGSLLPPSWRQWRCPLACSVISLLPCPECFIKWFFRCRSAPCHPPIRNGDACWPFSMILSTLSFLSMEWWDQPGCQTITPGVNLEVGSLAGMTIACKTSTSNQSWCFGTTLS